jgi:hypothetical protein
MNHLKPNWYQIQAAQDELDPTAEIRDPAEPVSANEITPRGSPLLI